MVESPLTLAEFFDLSPGKLLAEVLHREEHAELEAIIESTPGLAWHGLEEDFSAAFRAMLDVKITDIFLGAWVRLTELQEYLDADKHPPTEVSRVPLKRHSIKSTHRPSVEILIGDRNIAKLEFDVILQLKIEAFVLRIQGGRVWEISPGEYQAIGALQFRGYELARISSNKYRLPGKVLFDSGISIPRLSIGV